MSDSASISNMETPAHIEKLLDAANSASQTVAAIHVAFTAFVAYLGVIVWSTTHVDLLRISPVKLPILDVELPLTTFYCFVPWLVVLLHFNLLMQLELLSLKLWRLDQDIPNTTAGDQMRDRLIIFPFTQFIVGRSTVPLMRYLLSLVVGVTVIALPLFILSAAQIRFLPFHDEGITWSQRLAVWFDAVMLLALWPLIASPQDRAREWWSNLSFRLFTQWPGLIRYWATRLWNRVAGIINSFLPNSHCREFTLHPVKHPEIEPKGMIFLLTSIPIILLLSIFAVVPGSITLANYSSGQNQNYFEDWLIRKVPKSWLSVVTYSLELEKNTCLPLNAVFIAEESDTQDKQAEKERLSRWTGNFAEARYWQVKLGTCARFNSDAFFERNLDLTEATLVPKDVSFSQVTRATDPDKSIRESALKEFAGLNLKNRDLRFANLYGAVLPKADLRDVQLRGAILLRANMQDIVYRDWNYSSSSPIVLSGAILAGAGLQGIDLSLVDLRKTDLRGANLQGTDLHQAKLLNVDMRGANLEGANLAGADLSGANLRGVNFQGANLSKAKLSAADLVFANLTGTNLAQAILVGTDLRQVQLSGSDWSGANLDAATITKAPSIAWKERDRHHFELLLKPTLDDEQFSELQKRLQSENSMLPAGKPGSQTGCFSTDPEMLACDYREAAQLKNYLHNTLHPRLLELACSNAELAESIANRGFHKYAVSGQNAKENIDPNSGLANVLVSAFDGGQACEALASLPEQYKVKLRNAAKAR